MGHQSYVLLCTETTLSTPPVVQPKSSCDVHLLRSPCPSVHIPESQNYVERAVILQFSAEMHCLQILKAEVEHRSSLATPNTYTFLKLASRKMYIFSNFSCIITFEIEIGLQQQS